MLKVGLLLANGFEETECIVPSDILLRTREIELIKVAICDIDDPCINFEDSKYIVKGSHNLDLFLDMNKNDAILLNEKNYSTISAFDAFMLPGGSKGAENLSKSLLVKRLLQEANKMNKLICAICASPAAVLGKFGIISRKKNSKATCYPGCVPLSLIEKSDNPDELYSHAGKDGKGVVYDKVNHTICAQAAGHAFEFGFAIAKCLLGEKASEKVASSIYYNTQVN